jgi:hypothetical protein
MTIQAIYRGRATVYTYHRIKYHYYLSYRRKQSLFALSDKLTKRFVTRALLIVFGDSAVVSVDAWWDLQAGDVLYMLQSVPLSQS